MPDRNRVSNSAIGGWVVAGLLLGIVIGQWVTITNLPSSPSSSEPSHAANNDGDAKQSSTFRQSQETNAYDPGCPYPKNREDADLCEQRRMAKAAEEAQALAASQWLWYVAQAGATIAAALAAAYAAWVASKAADAAQATVSTMQENAERELRAYVGMFKLDISALAVDQQTAVFVRVRNFGQTPAYELRAWLDLKIADKNETAFAVQTGHQSRRVLNPQDGYAISSEHEIILTQADF